MLLRHAAATDVGRMRDHNEDTFAIEHGDGRAPAGALFAVCDGMGGHARGEVASDLAARAISAHYRAHGDDAPDALLQTALAAANEAVLAQGNGDMGTTAVAALVRHNVATVVNVGDCRAYLVRDGEPRQITRDHSFVAEQVAAGIITDEQAKSSSYRHIVTRAVGYRGGLDVDVYHEPLQVNDVLVLCSDGLHGQVEAHEIALAVTKVALDKACKKLIELANTRGGPDNITIIAAKVEALDDQVPEVAGVAAVATAAAPASTAAMHSTTTPSPAVIVPVTNHATTARSGVQHRTIPPPLARPVEPSTRGPLVWLVSLSMIAALSFGGYTLWRIQQTSAEPPPAVAAPTLTPLGVVTETPDASLLLPDVTETAISTDTAIVTDTAVLFDTPAPLLPPR